MAVPRHVISAACIQRNVVIPKVCILHGLLAEEALQAQLRSQTARCVSLSWCLWWSRTGKSCYSRLKLMPRPPPCQPSRHQPPRLYNTTFTSKKLGQASHHKRTLDPQLLLRLQTRQRTIHRQNGLPAVWPICPAVDIPALSWDAHAYSFRLCKLR